MRFLGLVTVVVIAIFASAFGVYHWLGGGPDSANQIANPPSPPTEVGNGYLSSDPTSQADGASRQDTASQSRPETAPGSGETSTAVSDTSPATAGGDAVSGPGAEGAEARAAQPGAAQPSSPMVVARVLEKAGSQSETRPAGEVPSFDVVRVEKSGEAILAGRAPPGSEVTIYDGDTPLGIVTADSRGQWVLVLDIPLVPGSHSLGVTARLADQSPIESADLVIVAVPEPQDQQERAIGTTAALGDASGQPDAEGQQTAAQSDVGITANDPPFDGSAESDDAPDGLIAPSQVAVADTGVTEPIAVIVPRHGAGPARILQKTDTGGEGIGNGGLFLDSVDYDDDGRAVIGGRANAGAALIVYLDNIPVGEALTGEDGRWAMTPEELVPSGLHRLRVDQVETDGRVLARVETPFSRAETIASHPDENFVTVQPGNSLWRIARTTFGQGTRYTVIYEINKEQIRDPDLIYPGQIFRLPSDG